MAFWKNCIFDLCGVEDFYRKTYSIIATSTMNERVAWLREVTETVNRYFPDQ
jgi:NAD(P)H dehydrogenase (quinone)